MKGVYLGPGYNTKYSLHNKYSLLKLNSSTVPCPLDRRDAITMPMKNIPCKNCGAMNHPNRLNQARGE